ncbi:MAG: hypothetical protein ACJ8CB_27150 [Ktedonobacteraceae bacterium]
MMHMVHFARLVPSARHKLSRGGRYNNGSHLDKGREKAASKFTRGFGHPLIRADPTQPLLIMTLKRPIRPAGRRQDNNGKSHPPKH